MFTSANTMIKLKIKKNNRIIDLLEIENKIIKLEMVIRYRLLSHNTEYITEIKKIISVENDQLLQYKMHNEHYINELTNNINSFELDVKELKQELNALRQQLKDVIIDINAFNNAIPVLKYIINCKITDLAHLKI